jgi:ParB family chromosome partitioning protein
MARKSGLGKGLDALIPSGDLPGETTSLVELPLDAIQPNPYQPRKNITDSDLLDLVQSILEHGILQPLIVTPSGNPGEYFLVAGERRWRAARQAGLTTVPVMIRTVTDVEHLELALIENLQRTDLSPLETAEAYRQLHESFGLSHEAIAHRVGKSRESVTNTIRLVRLATGARKALADGLITEGHARALLALSDPSSQDAALQTVINGRLTVRQTEELVKHLLQQHPPRKRPMELAPELQDVEKRLENKLHTRVKFHPGANGGSLVIHYYSDEELNTILSVLLGE